MAWAKGTVTDWVDFVRKLRDYAAGIVDPASDSEITSGVQVPSGQRWAIQSLGGGMTAIPSSGSATDGECYLIGPGSDPSDQIVVGMRTYRNVGNSIYGVQCMGATAYNSALTFTTMPGVSPNLVQTPLSNVSFTCWFWVNERRIMAAARIGTVDLFFHLGFIRQYGTRSQYPYPLVITGCSQDTSYNLLQNNFGVSCLPDPCFRGACLRWVDGTWQDSYHYSNNSQNRGQARNTAAYGYWPQRDLIGTNKYDDTDTTFSEDYLFGNFSSTNAQLSSSEISAFPMLPVVLHSPVQLVGEVDGLYVVPGIGITAGDTISDGTDTYDVFHNTYKSEAADFFVVRRL
jgi:hypothetical protein